MQKMYEKIYAQGKGNAFLKADELMDANDPT